MDDLLIETLETLGYDVIKQGSLDADNEYPEAFFTYFNWDSPRDKYYDNKHKSVTYYYQIQFYSSDVKTIDKTLEEVILLLEQNNFNLDSDPTDGYSDIPNYICKSFEINIEKRRK